MLLIRLKVAINLIGPQSVRVFDFINIIILIGLLSLHVIDFVKLCHYYNMVKHFSWKSTYSSPIELGLW
jgi:hypothetical protein